MYNLRASLLVLNVYLIDMDITTTFMKKNNDNLLYNHRRIQCHLLCIVAYTVCLHILISDINVRYGMYSLIVSLMESKEVMLCPKSQWLNTLLCGSGLRVAAQVPQDNPTMTTYIIHVYVCVCGGWGAILWHEKKILMTTQSFKNGNRGGYSKRSQCYLLGITTFYLLVET